MKVKEKMHKAASVKAKVGSILKSPTEATTGASAPLADPLIETPAPQSAFLPRDAEAGSGTQRRLLFR